MAEPEIKSAAQQIDAEIIAVIAAAVDAVIDMPFEIIDVTERRPDGSVVSSWAFAGRRQILYSHNIR
jgi:hypothetical protein